MILEHPDQIVFNTRWFQDLFSKKYEITEVENYITRQLNFNNVVLTGDNDEGYYDTYISGLDVAYSYDDKIRISVSPGRAIIDSTYFEFPNIINLDILPTVLTSQYNELSLLVVIEYKYDRKIETKATFRLFLLDTLTGNISEGWNEKSHYMIIGLYNINKTDRRLKPFYRLEKPECNTDDDLIIPDIPEPEPVEIDYEHSHSFIHTHEYTEEHSHIDILVNSTSIGGRNDIIPEPEPPPEPELPDYTLPHCNLFYDYKNLPKYEIIINGKSYQYYPKWYFEYYMKMFIFMLQDYLSRLYVTKTLVPFNLDLMVNNTFRYNIGGS